MQYKLVNIEQGTMLIKTLWPKMKEALASGKELCLTIEDAKRSDDQNKKYHAIIAEIAKQAKHMGAHWDAEDFKRLLVDQFATETGLGGSKLTTSLDGQRIVQLGLQTRKFTKEQGSEFIEWLTAWATDKGIEIKDVNND
jgi:hypothetical protein